MAVSYADFRSRLQQATRVRRFDTLGVTAEPAEIDGRPARVYRPCKTVGPPLLYFHGGAFIVGDLETHDRLCCRLAAYLSAAVIAATYGLAPKTDGDTMLANAVRAAEWLESEAAALGLEGGMRLGGDSAGGYLAARTALARPGSAKSLLLLYPLLQIDLKAWGREAFRGSRAIGLPAIAIMTRLGLGRCYRPLWELDLSSLPPTVLLAGDWFDPVSPDAPRFLASLRGSGIEHRQLVERGLIHGELCFPDRSRRADRALQHAAATLQAIG